MRKLIVLAFAASALALPAGAAAQVPDPDECMPYVGDCARVTVDYVLATEDEVVDLVVATEDQVVDRVYNRIFGPPCACDVCYEIWGEPCSS